MERIENISNKDMLPIDISLYGTAPATAANYDMFFIADRPYEIMQISEIHRVKGTNAGAVSLNVEKLTGTTALDSGVTVCVSSFDLKGTNYTRVTKVGLDLQNRLLNAGDHLALKDTGTLTSVAGLCVSVLLKPQNKGDYR